VTQLRLAHGVLPARLVVSCIGSGEASLVAHRLARGRSVDSDIVVAAIAVSCAVWLRLQPVEQKSVGVVSPIILTHVVVDENCSTIVVVMML